MKRYGQIIGVDPQNFQKYKEYHAAVWPEVLKTGPTHLKK